MVDQSVANVDFARTTRANRSMRAGLAVVALAALGVFGAGPSVAQPGHVGASSQAGVAASGGQGAAQPARPTQGATKTNGGPAGSVDLLAPMLDILRIGNPLPQLPDCADSRTPDGRDVRAFCVELRGNGVLRQIGVPRDHRPPFMDGPHALAIVDRNALVGIILPTDGLRNETRAMQTLTARYGAPFRQERVPMLDRRGKTVETTHAGWRASPLTVELYAIPEDPDTGSIELLLPRARVLMAEQDAAVEQQLGPASAPAAGKAPPSPAQAPKPQPGKPGAW